jgi:hypothetical protein
LNQPSSGDDKLAALRLHHALNPRAQSVRDPAFTSGHPFFDARDLVQVKYEMLRRARQEGQSVSQAATAFGFCADLWVMPTSALKMGPRELWEAPKTSA